MGELDKDYKKIKDFLGGVIILAVFLLIGMIKMGTTSFVVTIPIYLLFRFKYHIRFYKIFIGVHLVFTAMFFWVLFDGPEFDSDGKQIKSGYSELEDIRCNETIGLINHIVGGTIPCWYPEDIFSENNPNRAMGLSYKVKKGNLMYGHPDYAQDRRLFGYDKDVNFFWTYGGGLYANDDEVWRLLRADVDEVSPVFRDIYSQTQIIYKKPKYQKLTEPLSNPWYGIAAMVIMLFYYFARENT
jgi:hypothetical protein